MLDLVWMMGTGGNGGGGEERTGAERIITSRPFHFRPVPVFIRLPPPPPPPTPEAVDIAATVPEDAVRVVSKVKHMRS